MKALFKINTQAEFIDYVLNAILTDPMESGEFERVINITLDDRKKEQIDFYAEYCLPGRIFEVIYGKSQYLCFIESDEVFHKYAQMVQKAEEDVYMEDFQEAFRNATRIGLDGEPTTLSRELIKSIHEVERKYRLLKR